MPAARRRYSGGTLLEACHIFASSMIPCSIGLSFVHEISCGSKLEPYGSEGTGGFKARDEHRRSHLRSDLKVFSAPLVVDDDPNIPLV